MKKLLLLLLLLPFTALATFHKGELILNDSTVKAGYIELPNSHDQKKLRFKATEDGDVEKFTAEEVKSFHVEGLGDYKNEAYYYVTCKLADNKMIGEGFRVAKGKSWVRLEYAGTINIVTATTYQNGTWGALYYVHFPKEDVAKYLGVFYGGMSITNEEFTEVKRQAARIFDDKCPDVSKNLKKADTKRPNVIIELYDKYCGK